MAYSARHYAQALYELAQTQTEGEQKKTVAALVARLSAQGRTGIVPEVIERIGALARAHAQRDALRIVSAQPLSSAQQKTIKEQFPASTYEFTTDESLIAGIVIQKHNSVWYANLATASQQLRASIVR